LEHRQGRTTERINLNERQSEQQKKYHEKMMKIRLHYRFLIGVVSMHLKDYRKAHQYFEHIIGQKHIDKERFLSMFTLPDYVHVLLSDADCLMNKI